MIWYVTRETVKGALDIKSTARTDAQVDRCIGGATEQVTGLLRRRFDPWTGTRRFPSTTGTLWFGERALVQLDALAVDDVAQTVADYLLLPVDEGPPYDGIIADTGTSAAALTGSTTRYPVALTGVWGYDLDETSAGATAEALDASETAVDLTGPASAAVGVGSVLRVGTERMTVTGRQQLSTGVTLAANVGAGRADTSVQVSSGAGITEGELVLVDAEKMLVHEVTGNVLVVTRGYDGSVLAAHLSGATVYAPRTVTVNRGVLGTTAATHADAAPVYVWQPPALVEELALAYALTALGQQQSGYARTVGTGENEREASGRGLRQVEADAVRAFKRWRTAAV